MKKSIITSLHVGYWSVYALLLGFIFIMMKTIPMGNGYASNQYVFQLLLGFGVIPGVLAFYGAYAYVFDKWLKQRAIGRALLSCVIVAILSGISGVIVLNAIAEVTMLWDVFISVAAMMAVVAMIHCVLGLVLKGFISWYKDLKRNEELTKENHATELALVKAQLDPHFLFNTINNIDVMIELDAVKASNYLQQLSDLMRYMLYNSKEEMHSLADEVAYLNKYIELQKLRTSNPNFVKYELQGEMKDDKVPAMLFMPFIENAFKYSDKNGEEGIQITIARTQRGINFTCKNKVKANTSEPSGGLGLDLIRKRLDLIYGERHNLIIKELGDYYSVNLKIVHDQA